MKELIKKLGSLIVKYISWDSLSVIIACLTLIITTISIFREKRKSIIIEQRVREQEKFENEIEHILDFYPRMLEDYVVAYITAVVQPNLKIKFDLSSLDTINMLNCKYACELITIKNKVDFLYKFHDSHHPEYDLFKNKITRVNKTINDTIYQLGELINKCINNHVGYPEKEAQALNEQRNKLVMDLVNNYQKNINELYILANHCIEERKELNIKNRK